jgi:hypothetical protein
MRFLFGVILLLFVISVFAADKTAPAVCETKEYRIVCMSGDMTTISDYDSVVVCVNNAGNPVCTSKKKGE